MTHLAVVPVTAFMRTIAGCRRKPFRIGNVARSLVRMERVSAMHAGLGLDHNAQNTRESRLGGVQSDQINWRRPEIR